MLKNDNTKDEIINKNIINENIKYYVKNNVK